MNLFAAEHPLNSDAGRGSLTYILSRIFGIAIFCSPFMVGLFWLGNVPAKNEGIVSEQESTLVVLFGAAIASLVFGLVADAFIRLVRRFIRAALHLPGAE